MIHLIWYGNFYKRTTWKPHCVMSLCRIQSLTDTIHICCDKDVKNESCFVSSHGFINPFQKREFYNSYVYISLMHQASVFYIIFRNNYVVYRWISKYFLWKVSFEFHTDLLMSFGDGPRIFKKNYNKSATL